MAVDSVETADYYKDNNPKLYGGLCRMSGGDYSIQLREDAVPFALSTPRRVSVPLMDVIKRELQRMEDLQVIRRVDTPTDWCAGIVVVAKPRVVASTVEGEEKETHKVRICMDLTKLNETLPRHGIPTRQVHSKPVDSDSAGEGSPTEEESVDVGTEPTTCILPGEGRAEQNACAGVVRPKSRDDGVS